MRAPGIVELARYISWMDGINGDLNQALVSLCLVLDIFVVSINLCLRVYVASNSQVIGPEGRFLLESSSPK